MDQVRIHQLTLDGEAYDRLLALWQRAGLYSIKPQGRDSREALKRQLASGVATLLGLEADGRLVGAVIATHDSRKGWINRLAIDPAFRRMGYGTRLVEAAEAVLREQGIDVIATLIMSYNEASLSMFREAGYEEVEGGVLYLTKRKTDSV